jgi:hypothetical protein
MLSHRHPDRFATQLVVSKVPASIDTDSSLHLTGSLNRMITTTSLQTDCYMLCKCRNAE